MAQSVYIMTSGKSRFKVGISKHPTKRVKQLQTGNPDPIKLLWVSEMKEGIKASSAESTIHSVLKEMGLHATGEWFNMSDDQVVELASTMKRCLEEEAVAAPPQSTSSTLKDFESLFPHAPVAPPKGFEGRGAVGGGGTGAPYSTPIAIRAASDA